MSLFLMNLKVKKRDGTIALFEEGKIRTAIRNPFLEVYSNNFDVLQEREINNITEAVCRNLERDVNLPYVSAEYIENVIERELMSTDPSVAKAYILGEKNKNKE